MFFESSKGKIWYDIIGEGEPLLMVHGTPFSSRVWYRFIETLKYNYRIYIFDLLGYGQSDKTADDISLGVQNIVLSELLEYWNLEKPYVVAHDFGGATVLRSILLNQKTYKKMLLMDIVALSPWGSPFVQYIKNYEDVFNQIPDYIHEAIVKAYIKDALYNKDFEAKVEFLVEPWLSAEGKKAFYKQIAQMDQRYTDEVQNRYSEIKIPTKILWAEEDNWIPIQKGKELHSLISSSEFVSIPKAGHLLQIDQRRMVIEEIVNFLKD